MVTKRLDYKRGIKIREFEVKQPFLHFEKGDKVDLVLKLRYNESSFGHNKYFMDVGVSLVGVFQNDTVLPAKALYDSDFFERLHTPNIHEDFLLECGIEDYFLSQSLHHLTDYEDKLSEVVNLLRKLWFGRISMDHAVHEFKNKDK